uniref:Uncharacterized protein n=1 Tax=Rhizobium leguminosarum TaxID=384 RepID=A0A179BXQ5_RHILE|nr:hypothetical protein A4U53_13405 [Rhizobium leguminosarum]
MLFRCCLIFCPEVEFAKGGDGPDIPKRSGFSEGDPIGQSLRNCLCAKRAGQVERLCQLRQILGNAKTKKAPMDAAAGKAELATSSLSTADLLSGRPGD